MNNGIIFPITRNSIDRMKSIIVRFKSQDDLTCRIEQVESAWTEKKAFQRSEAVLEVNFRRIFANFLTRVASEIERGLLHVNKQWWIGLTW